VTLVSKTRPDNPLSNEFVKSYLDWGGTKGFAEFNSSRKAHAAFNGKFSPDIEDVNGSDRIYGTKLKIIKRMPKELLRK
jgi:hypothetical protein